MTYSIALRSSLLPRSLFPLLAGLALGCSGEDAGPATDASGAGAAGAAAPNAAGVGALAGADTGMAQAGTSGAAQAGTPGDMGGGVAGAPGGVAGAMNGGVAGAMNGGVAGAMNGGVAGAMNGGVAGAMNGGGAAGAMNGGVAGAMNGGGAAGAMNGGVAGMAMVDPDVQVPDATTACTINVTNYDLSETIGSVGIVEWNTDLAGMDRAVIEFGLDTNYGKTVPADITAPNFRSLILGMKAARDYHFRVVAIAGETSCASEDFSLTTSDVPNLPGDFLFDSDMTVTTPLPDQVAPGYIITSRWNSAPGPAFIFDEDRDVVWWYFTDGGMTDDVFRARMSYDGKSMWLRSTAQSGGGVVRKVSMDGTEEGKWDLDSTTHDLAVLPDGKVALVDHASNGCDEIIELDPATGMTSQVFNLTEAHGSTNCHVNALAYYEPDDAYIVSDYEASMFAKVSRQGQLLWILNGNSSTFEMGTTWYRQHNLHMYDTNHIVIFSNGGNGQPTTAFDFLLDETANTATEIWRYEDGPSTQFGGDVQRLHNGNTLITYSVSGEIREVNPAGELVQTIAMKAGFPFAHSVHRKTLYGAPPRLKNLADETN